MRNKNEDLRNHLFATLESLLDKEDPMDVSRAKAVAQVSQTIINSAMAEVKAFKALKGQGNGFFAKQLEAPKR